jgi:hypothetical protein
MPGRRGNRKSLVDMPKAKGVDVREELLRYYKCGRACRPRCALAERGRASGPSRVCQVKS